MIRTFVAIELPLEVLTYLERAVANLRTLGLKGRFIKAYSMHLTLKFLGKIGEDRIPSIVQALEESASGTAPFQLSIRKIGVFPHLVQPRVVWMGIEPSEPLHDLSQRLESYLELLGFHQELRSFQPHLTLLRLKSRQNLAALVHYVEQQRSKEQAEIFLVRAIHLYQSLLKPSGAEYSKLATVKLAVNLRHMGWLKTPELTTKSKSV